ncbi:MAG: polyphosphate kinase 1 [Erysipelotrichaceae bacterium]
MKETTHRHFYQNRELSWLKFDERVLEEAKEERLPLFERLRSVGIFEHNLDEFYMIRVGSLFDLSHLKEPIVDNKTGMSVSQQLDAIYLRTHELYKAKDQVVQNLLHRFKTEGMEIVEIKELSSKETSVLDAFWRKQLQPILSPQIVDMHHPFPHIASNTLFVGLWLKKEGHYSFGLVQIPASMSRLVVVGKEPMRGVPIEKVLLEYVAKVFHMYNIEEKIIFTITRNADLAIDDALYELEPDFLHLMKKLLKKRERLAAVKLEYSNEISEPFLQYLMERFHLRKVQLYRVKSLLLVDGFLQSLQNALPSSTLKAHSFEPFEPPYPKELKRNRSLIRQIQKKDVLLYYPYDSFEPFLQLLHEAAWDEQVVSIKITIYRVCNHSRLIDMLCLAAQHKKEVSVLMELRARFDEESNIDYATQLEESGCTVLYGVEHFKVHSKICLITRIVGGKMEFITQIGTGNYNEVTVKQYTDFSYFTANATIGEDAALFFQNMAIGNLDGQYQRLICSPYLMKERFMALIDQEIEWAKRGEAAYVYIKANALSEVQFMEKLREASIAGVRVELMIRGICCLLPGIVHVSEHIEVRSIVGRFLEHSRVYRFGSGTRERLFIASADPMTRNLEKRVEIACEIQDPVLKQKLNGIVALQWQDNAKARKINSQGNYERIISSKPLLDAQAILLASAQEGAGHAATNALSLRQRLAAVLKGWALRLEKES